MQLNPLAPASSDSPTPTSDGSRRSGSGGDATRPPTRLRRSPLVVLAGVLVTILGGLAGAWIWSSASASESVVKVISVVNPGERLTQKDLALVTVGSTPGIDTVPGDQLAGQIGKRAVTTLAPGTLLARSDVTDDPQPAKAHAQVGLKLDPGHMPTTNVSPGAKVWLVVSAATASDNSQGNDATVADAGTTFPAVVVSGGNSAQDSDEQTADDGSVSSLMTVDVSQGDAATIAQLAAAGQISVVRLSDVN